MAARDGRDGIDGADGAPGLTGPEGPRGPAGRDGPQGPVGPVGPEGKQGPQGEQGPVGPEGAQGARGAEGRMGINGRAGSDGAQGARGPKGPQGEPGPMPKHRWNDSVLYFENPDGTWDEGTDLRGPPGKDGKPGPSPYYLGGGPITGGGGDVPEAPNDGLVYVRGSLSWIVGVPEAPQDNQPYVRKNGAWFVAVSGGSATWGNIIGDLSDQTDLVLALADKADTADLADVALSGSYVDLVDKPTIPPIAFSFGDATPNDIYTATVDGTFTDVRMTIETDFDGTGPSVALGVTGDLDALLATNQSDPTEVGAYENAPDVHVSAGDQVIISITPGSGASQGAGRVFLVFVPD